MEITDASTLAIQKLLSLISVMQDSCRDLNFYLSKECNKTPQDLNTYTYENKYQLLLNDLVAGISALLQYSEPLKANLNHAFYKEMAENIDDALCNIIEYLNEGLLIKAVHLLDYQIFPSLQELWEELYFWGNIYPDEKRMKEYYKKEFADHHANTFLIKGLNADGLSIYKYKISFFIPVFNKLDYTKQCINSILKNTNFTKYPCEFILLNDGSTDGTQKYLESLELNADIKIVSFRKNVKTLIFSLAFRICEGEYFLFVNNDTLVTTGWLDNLLTCIESDPMIISATPCTPNTTNRQSDIEGLYPYKTTKDTLLHKNHSNPALWEERARIMPVIALYRSALVNKIGFADRLFYTMEFWDDDFSLRARRAGYKQILCRDTYCHHFGSITGKAGQLKENTLEKGRAIFYLKNHSDPWNNDFCYDYEAISLIQRVGFSNTKSKTLTILGIDCGYGDSLRQIKNIVKRNLTNINANSTKITVQTACTILDDENCSSDLRSISDQNLSSKNFHALGQEIGENCLDYIYLGRPLERYIDYASFLSMAKKTLKKNGILLFSVTNVYFKPVLESFLALAFPYNSMHVCFLNIASLQKKLAIDFTTMECAAPAELISGVENFKIHHILDKNNSSALPLLSTKYLKFCCKK